MAATSVGITAALSWALEKTVTGFDKAKQKGQVSYTPAPAVATYNAVFAAEYTILAAGTQAVDFYSFTDLVGNAVTATKIYGVLVTVTGTNAAVKIETHGTNGLVWFFGGTTPSITVPAGGCFLFSEGGTEALSATVRQWLLTNTGSGTATVTVAAICGT